MSYHLTPTLGQTPPPEPTAQALSILATCAVPVLPIAALAIGGRLVAPKSGLVAPVVGGLLGTVISVLALRSKVLAGSASFGPREA